MLTKAELREAFRRQRAELSSEAWQAASRRLAEGFFKHFSLEQPGRLHTFLPIADQREPNTWLIIERLWRDFPHIQVVVSKTRWKSRQLDHYYLEPNTRIVPNRWGIPEPRDARSCDDASFRWVLVPLLAVDQQGHRLGYGGGFYDRFLQRNLAGSYHIGLSMFPVLDHPIPEQHAYDQPLTHCLSPDNFYDFSTST